MKWQVKNTVNAKKVIEMLNDRDVFDLLEELEAQPIDRGNTIDALTVCHRWT